MDRGPAVLDGRELSIHLFRSGRRGTGYNLPPLKSASLIFCWFGSLFNLFFLACKIRVCITSWLLLFTSVVYVFDLLCKRPSVNIVTI